MIYTISLGEGGGMSICQFYDVSFLLSLYGLALDLKIMYD